MAATDIRPVGVEVEFKDVPLDPPFVIAGRPMTHLTAALVHMRAETQQGSSTDRKSTRLNSSHVATSYAVFCVKKKNDIEDQCPLLSEGDKTLNTVVNARASNAHTETQ